MWSKWQYNVEKRIIFFNVEHFLTINIQLDAENHRQLEIWSKLCKFRLLCINSEKWTFFNEKNQTSELFNLDLRLRVQNLLSILMKQKFVSKFKIYSIENDEKLAKNPILSMRTLAQEKYPNFLFNDLDNWFNFHDWLFEEQQIDFWWIFLVF